MTMFEIVLVIGGVCAILAAPFSMRTRKAQQPGAASPQHRGGQGRRAGDKPVGAAD